MIKSNTAKVYSKFLRKEAFICSVTHELLNPQLLFMKIRIILLYKYMAML